jgi:tetratricopeptide (TPR) repeat protein
MANRFARALPALLLCTSLVRDAVSHDGIHEQIEAVTREIGQTPEPRLYLRRGELHRIHRDWTAALADYAEAARLEPRNELVEFCRGRMFLEAGRLLEAEAALDRHLARNPGNAEALLARARVLSQAGRHEAAAGDYTRAIERFGSAKPDLYVERARAQTAAGRIEAGLLGLDEGIRKLGPLVTLELPAIDLELRLRRCDQALARLDAVSRQSPRKEMWLARRGEILELSGRAAEAADAYAAAMKAIEALALEQRRTAVMVELAGRVQSAQARLRLDTARK